MKSRTSTEFVAADQLLAMAENGHRYELVNGELILVSPAGSEHGRIAMRIALRLAEHVEKMDIGIAYAAETGFRIALDPDTVRAPDASFVSHHRLASVEATSGYLPLAPDLAVEVVSPGDTFSQVEAKAGMWLEKGTMAVVVADATNRSLYVYRDNTQIQILHFGDTFVAGDACAGLEMLVDDVFGPIE